MCAACIDFKDPDAPPVRVLIAAIKQQLRRQRQIIWGARALAALAAIVIIYLTWAIFNGAFYMMVFVFIDFMVVWLALRFAEQVAVRADHTLIHLRRTEALKDAE